MFHKRVGIFLFFFLIAVVYIHNISADVFGVDVGDFVTSSYVWGIAHPPGYPLIVVTSGILMRILPFFDPIKVLGGVSAASSLLTLVILYMFVRDLTKSKIISLISTGILAFSYLFWLYSEVGEAFALNNLICMALLYSAYKFAVAKKPGYLYPVGFLCGIGISHHHTFVFLLPSILILIYKNLRMVRKPKVYFKILGFFFLGVLPYAYVFTLFFHQPVINWMGELNFENFVNLITRRAYGTFQATAFHINSPNELLVVFKTYVFGVINSLSLPVVAISLLGFINLFKKSKNYFLAITAAFLITGPFFNTFAGFPLYSYFNLAVAERFYIISTVILIFPFAYGLLAIENFLTTVLSRKEYVKIILYAFFLIPLLLLVKNYAKTDLSNLSIGNEYAHNLLSSVPSGSVLFLSGDTALFNTWYVRYVKNEREDIVLARPHDNYIMNTLKNDYDKYFSSNPNKTRRDFIFSIVEKRPVVSVDAFDIGSKSAYLWVPRGVGYQLLPKDVLPSHAQYLEFSEKYWSKYAPKPKSELLPHERNLASLDVLTRYPQALTETAWFLYKQYEDSSNAKKFLQRANALDPSYAKSYATLGVILHDTEGNCKESLELLRKSVLLNPLGKNSYILLDGLASNCKADNFDSKTTQEFLRMFDVDPSSLPYEN